MNIDPRIKEVLISERELDVGIAQAANWINETYKNQSRPVLLVGILKGCIPFLGKLLPLIKVDCELDFITASSYHGGLESSNFVKIITDVKNDVKDRDVVLIEDIIDTARTINNIVNLLKSRKANSVKIVSLLDKPAARNFPMKIDYVCFTVPKVFVVGFGLDYNEIFRNLPYIGVLKEEVYQK